MFMGESNGKKLLLGIDGSRAVRFDLLFYARWLAGRCEALLICGVFLSVTGGRFFSAHGSALLPSSL